MPNTDTNSISALLKEIEMRIEKAHDRLENISADETGSPNHRLEYNVIELLTVCQESIHKFIENNLKPEISSKLKLASTFINHERKSHDDGGIFKFKRFSVNEPKRKTTCWQTLTLLGIEKTDTETVQKWLDAQEKEIEKNNNADLDSSEHDGFAKHQTTPQFYPPRFFSPRIQNDRYEFHVAQSKYECI